MCTRGPRKGRGCEVPERGVKAGCGEAGVGNGEAEDEWRGGGAKRRAAAPPLDPARPKTQHCRGVRASLTTVGQSAASTVHDMAGKRAVSVRSYPT